MQVLRLMTISFWCGWIASMAMQDWYGLEKWIIHLRENWVYLHWGIGAIVSFAGVYWYIYFRMWVMKSLKERNNDS